MSELSALSPLLGVPEQVRMQFRSDLITIAVKDKAAIEWPQSFID